MYKKTVLSIVAIIFLTSCMQSQWFGNKVTGNGNVIKETRTVENYDEISISGFSDVNLVKGKEGELSIKIEDNLLEYLITEVKNDVLKIRFKKGVSIHTEKGIFIEVPFKEISKVSLSGSGDIVSDAVINANDFSISLAGSGDISLKVDADHINSSLAGSGDITIIGNTYFLKASVAGSGDFHAFALETKKAEVSVAGSGDANVNVSNDLRARVMGSGDIEYTGNPELVDTKVIGSGDIERR